MPDPRPARSCFSNKFKDIQGRLQQIHPKMERPVAWGTTGLPLSPPGCGISKPWGVWEGASMKRPGEPPADYLNFLSQRRGKQRLKCQNNTFINSNVSDQLTVANR